MDTTQAAIRAYFKKLGLESEIADIYLALHSYGPQGISALARNSKVERTRVYRLIDQLNESNLVEVEAHAKRGVIKAAPIANLRILINKREEELKNLQDELELIEQALARNSLSDGATRVQFYYGAEGIRHMLWNELNATTALAGQGYRLPEEVVGKKLMEQWAAQFQKSQLSQRLLVGADFVDSWGEASSGSAARQQVKGVEYHFIDPKIFRINYGCTIYDGVVAYYNWEDDGVHGLEIHNQAMADSQRQLFELLWAQSSSESRLWPNNR